MIHPYWEGGGLRPVVSEPRGVGHFLATVILVNACLAVAFGFFYELVRLCLQLGVSPWYVAVVYVAGYAAFLWKECRSALPFLKPHNNGE